MSTSAAASAAWFRFHTGDLDPNQNAQTSSHQARYSKLMDWVNAGNCAKMWYRENGSSVEYYILQECDGYLQDDRNSFGDTWAYCRNVSSVTIYADCYTCINEPNACP